MFTKASEWIMTSQIQLEHDLGMTGKDAHEFMNIFMQKFDVDMSELKFDKYFGSEGFDCTSSPETPQK